MPAPYRYSLNLVAIALWPLSLLHCALMSAKRLAYHWRLLKSYRAEAPVIAVGALTAAGNSEALLLIRLAQVLKTAGYRPAVVSLNATAEPRTRLASSVSDPRQVGDRALLLARRCGCPVAVAPNPAAAARTVLIKEPGCNVILYDDGLLHYKLAREVEIAVLDSRRLGNGACLPAGPLRAARRRLRQVDFVVASDAHRAGEYFMTIVGDRALNLTDPDVSCALASFRGSLVHAVTGTEEPFQFFNHLRARGIAIREHVVDDRPTLTAADLDFGDTYPVLMTEQDALKCQTLALDRLWYVPLRVQLDPEFERRLLARLAREPNIPRVDVLPTAQPE